MGKSTLFNRLVGERKSIVADTEGVTRDRLEGAVNWLGKQLLLVDCGGIPHPVAEAREGVTRQVWKAVDDADLVVVVVDAHTGLVASDLEIVRALRRRGKKLVLAVNKVDHRNDEGASREFATLGIPVAFEISALTGRGTGDLLDYLSHEAGIAPQQVTSPARLAVVGRRNVGKSTLINRLVGEERVVVADAPGTTRDAVEIRFTRGEDEYILVDTAGLILRRTHMENIAYYSEVRALKAMETAAVVLFVLDARDGILRTDKRIGGRVKEAGKACVLVSNKWDTVPRRGRLSILKQEFQALVVRELGFLKYAPIAFVSALRGTGLDEIFSCLKEVRKWQTVWIPRQDLQQIVRGVSESYQNVIGESKITGGRQSGVDPTRFHIYVRNAEKLKPAVSQILEEEIRSFYPYTGVPIFFKFIEERERGEKVHRARKI